MYFGFHSVFQGTTCKPSMGYSFGAGTIDGPGGFDFKQGKEEDFLIASCIVLRAKCWDKGFVMSEHSWIRGPPEFDIRLPLQK